MWAVKLRKLVNVDKIDVYAHVIHVCFFWILLPLEYLLSNKSSAKDTAPIFIIGAPRSGTTILYQLLSNYFEVKYLSNISMLFYRYPNFGLWLHQLFYNNTPHNIYKSNLGRTYSFGLIAPNEGGLFWKKWIGNHNKLKSLNSNNQQPFVFKNTTLSLKLKDIKAAFPSAKIIYIKRNRLYCAQSILQARLKMFGTINEWFSVRPKNIAEIKSYSPYSQVAHQLLEIEAEIENNRVLFSNNWLNISYNELCEDSEKTLSKVHNFIGKAVSLRKNTTSLELKLSEKQQLSDIEFNKLQNEINKINWLS